MMICRVRQAFQCCRYIPLFSKQRSLHAAGKHGNEILMAIMLPIPDSDTVAVGSVDWLLGPVNQVARTLSLLTFL